MHHNNSHTVTTRSAGSLSASVPADASSSLFLDVVVYDVVVDRSSIVLSHRIASSPTMVTTARLTMALLAAACAVQYASAFCARPAWAGASATARRRPPPPTMKLQLTPEPGCPWIEELEVDVEPVRVQNVIFRPRGPSNYVCVKDDDGVDSVAINGNTLMPATDYLLGDGQVTKRDSMKIRWSRDCGGPHPPPLPSSMPSEQEERAWGQRQRAASGPRRCLGGGSGRGAE